MYRGRAVFYLVRYGNREISKGYFGSRPSQTIGAPSGNLEGSTFTGEFEKRTKEGSWNGESLSLSLFFSPSLYGSTARGTWKEGSSTWEFKEYVEEDTVHRHMCLVEGPWGSITGQFERKLRFCFTKRTFIGDSERYVNESPGTRRPSPYGFSCGPIVAGYFTRDFGEQVVILFYQEILFVG